MRARACKHEAAPICIEGLVHSVFLVGWPVADPHCHQSLPLPACTILPIQQDRKRAEAEYVLRNMGRKYMVLVGTSWERKKNISRFWGGGGGGEKRMGRLGYLG